MAKVTQRQIRLLEPYLEGNKPTHRHKDGTREWNMHCPLHEDKTRSASLNIDKGVWFCNKGCGAGRVTELIRRRAEWVDPGVVSRNGAARMGQPDDKPQVVLTEGMISGWNSALLSNDTALSELIERRGISTDSVRMYELGWHQDWRVYTIPVRDPQGDIWNVRYYNMHPPPDRRKIWGTTGYNSPPRLYPVRVLNNDPGEVLICEGEWDALLALQHGFPAVTRTGAADVWHSEWGEEFAGRTVYICQDRDEKGERGARKIGRALYRVADVRKIELPYPVVRKHGQDLTDFLQDHGPDALRELLDQSQPMFKSSTPESGEIETITVLDSFDARKLGEPARLVVTVKGRKEPGYSIPQKARLACTQDAGNKCHSCPLNAASGEAEVIIERDDPLVLALMESSNKNVKQEIAGAYGVPGGQCVKLQMEIEEHQAVEVLYARPALDHTEGSKTDLDQGVAGEYKNIRITSVGRHDTLSNNTVAVTGALQPNPRSQSNEWLAWEVEQLETSVDRFEVDDDVIQLLRRFQCRTGQRPIKKLHVIAKALSDHVTFIHERPEMHALMDLTFHSVLSFKFGGALVHRGWIESLIVGDTRTGKSEAAQQLVRHFGSGEVVGGEAASLAGLVGGLQQMGGKEWAVTWGVIPINDRRIVVIDELSGLLPEDIAKMSDVRSAGVAKLTKVQQDMTYARTRLMWLGNPRHSDSGMSDFTYGVDVLKPLIGNPEDIARFDLAMALRMDDVPGELINKPRVKGELKYTAEACHAMLLWCWTRQPDQIVWSRGAEETVFRKANELGKLYVENPPLVQAANIRIKIARVAAALAARLFSTDDSHQKVIITKEHVEDAVTFINTLYGMTAFGYRERSREHIADREEAEKNIDEIDEYLRGRPTLARFLRGTGKFRRQDVEEVLNYNREEANAVINVLWEARMVRKDLGDIRVQPTLHALLREGTW